MSTSLAAAIDELLRDRRGVDLATFMVNRRDRGEGYEAIARAIHAATNVPVSSDSVRRWVREAAINGGEAA